MRAVTIDRPHLPPPPTVFCMGAAGAHPRLRPEKYGFNANPRRHERPREVHGVAFRVGRSGAAANARQCVIWSLILGVWRPAARATIHQV